MIYIRKIMLINGLISILFLVDRLTKWLAFKIPEAGVFLYSENFFGLRLYKNFDLIFNLKIGQTSLYALVGAILVVLLWLFIKNYWRREIFMVFSLSLIIAGAVSNLIDRFYFGYVVDFLSFLNYSIFNLADIFIVVGVGLILLYEWQWARPKTGGIIT